MKNSYKKTDELLNFYSNQNQQVFDNEPNKKCKKDEVKRSVNKLQINPTNSFESNDLLIQYSSQYKFSLKQY